MNDMYIHQYYRCDPPTVGFVARLTFDSKELELNCNCQMCVYIDITHTRTHTHIHTHTITYARARAHIHTNMHTGTHTHTRNAMRTDTRHVTSRARASTRAVRQKDHIVWHAPRKQH